MFYASVVVRRVVRSWQNDKEATEAVGRRDALIKEAIIPTLPVGNTCQVG